jgi:hypothetical protein
VLGNSLLVEGQKYRQGFHAEVGTSTSITQTLEAYAAERAAGNLSAAKEKYENALTCAYTPRRSEHATRGWLDVLWERATGAMLEGNEELVQVLDVSPSGGSALIGQEIGQLEQAIQLYDEATTGYLEPLASDRYPGFLAALTADRPHPITSTETVSTTLPVDLERLALASAKKSQAYLELAERQFRRGDQVAAEVTLRQGKFQAGVELTLLYTLWPQVVSDANYTATWLRARTPWAMARSSSPSTSTGVTCLRTITNRPGTWPTRSGAWPTARSRWPRANSRR